MTASGLQDATTGKYNVLVPPLPLMARYTGYGPSAEIKLGDFGLCAPLATGGVIQDGMMHGTITYVSPEVLRGQGYGHGVDVWALGVVLFEAVEGSVPFDTSEDNWECKRFHGLVEGICSKDAAYDAAKWPDSELRRVTQAMLDKNVATRPSAQELADDPWAQAVQARAAGA